MAHITVPDQNPFIEYTATAGQTSFGFDFTFFDATDLRVTQDGVELPQSAFEVTGTSGFEGGYPSGTVVLDSAASAGDIVRIWSETPPVRINDFLEGAGLPARATNTELDKLTARLRDMRLRMQRIPTVSFAADDALDINTMGHLITNEGASGALDVVLPPASAGLRVIAAVVQAFSLNFSTDSTSDLIYDAGSSGDDFASSTVGSIAELVCVSDSIWLVVSKNGNWALS